MTSSRLGSRASPRHPGRTIRYGWESVSRAASNVGAAAGKYAVMALCAATVTAAFTDALATAAVRVAIGLVLPG